MADRNFVQQSLKTLIPALLLLFLGPAFASAQTTEPALKPDQLVKTINFKNVPVKVGIQALMKQLKLNVVFDDALADQEKITVELKDVTLAQALRIIFVQKQLQACLIEDNAVMIFPNTEANRQRYEQYPSWPPKSSGGN